MAQAGTRTVNGRTPAFSGDMAWASNLFEVVHYSRHFGRNVLTSEHSFNARKPVEAWAVDWILDAKDGAEAKRRGNARGRFTLQPGWDTGGRVRAMQDSLVDKFTVPEMRQLLIETGTEPLAETGFWHDTFWGLECFADSARCTPACARPGVNMLGELMMALRVRLQTGLVLTSGAPR